jgi:membrane fusion protein (multidrug efflux system)
MTFNQSGLTAIAALTLTQLTGCGVGEANSDVVDPDASTPLPVEVVTPRSGDITATYHTTTTITSDIDAPVTARADGEVIEILVEEGDLVKKGELLARLDGDRLRLQVIQAKANLEKTTREYERFINLHDRGLVSSATFDGMKFNLDALQARYELQQLNYSYTFIRAPLAGIVATRDIKIGQHLNSGDATFRVTNTSELVAHLLVPQSELAKFAAGHTAKIKVDAMPERNFAATIVRISPTIDARNGTFRATAYINNDEGMLAPGMFGRVEIAYEKHSNVLMIPIAAVLEEDNVSVVYVVDEGEAVRRPIKTGIEEDGRIEVLSGLDGNERIIVTGQNGLRDGSRVLASVSSDSLVAG